jgi:LytS/YehU family sensor histidine kinase
MVDQEQNPKLTKSIDTLSSLLRYVVYENQEPKVTIAKEIQFIKDFSALHLLRYEEDEIDFKMTITGNSNQQMVEMSIFLSFVENAFKHGLQPEITSYIHIDINIEQTNAVNFKITNSVHPQKMILKQGGYGLQATKDRLDLAYPNSHQLEINQNTNQYNVNLKLNTNESTNN